MVDTVMESVASAIVGDVVTTKLALVGETYWKVPARGPVATEPCSVLVKPVPVRAMVEPTGAPVARSVGEAAVIAGPDTVKALAKLVTADPFSRRTV
jgi:hypothetical protein